MFNILEKIQDSNRSLAILIDPEKMKFDQISAFVKSILLTISKLKIQLEIDQFFFFVGGSTMNDVDFNLWIKKLNESVTIPILIFPGSSKQLSEHAQGLLFLNLISGRNPDYLIEQQVQAASLLRNSSLEIIPSGYILVDGGNETAVQRISNTKPISQSETINIVNHAYAAQLMGNKLVYLEAGSGAKASVSTTIVQEVCDSLNIPVIVGGGLRTIKQIEDIFLAGSKVIVIGTAIEEDINWNG